jgi:hypothetical protein
LWNCAESLYQTFTKIPNLTPLSASMVLHIILVHKKFQKCINFTSRKSLNHILIGWTFNLFLSHAWFWFKAIHSGLNPTHLVGSRDNLQMKQNLGLVLSTKILRFEKFSKKVRKFKTYHLCHKGQKKYKADVLAWLAC